ncbi:hypothetical protein KM043_017008 [Ampulex compressa]|nr:hypothetical protein KM043_017008 [Ampulex compressa]
MSRQVGNDKAGAVAGVGADRRNIVSVRAGATLMKSVSIFLMSGRKASGNSKRQTSAGSFKQESRRLRRRRMPDGGSTRNSAHIVKVIDSLKRRTRFSRIELDSLCKLYKKLTTNSAQQQVGQSITVGKRPQSRKAAEGIDRSIFRDLLHNTFNVITEDTLIERMFCSWDRENEGIIRLETWILGLDVFLRGTLRDRIEFCFKVYDLNNDGYITKDEIFQLFKNCLLKQPGEEDPDEGVRDLSELALKKLDVDRDGKISFADYRSAVKEEPLLLEAFGRSVYEARANGRMQPGNYALAVIVVQLVLVYAQPPTIGHGTYEYDPTSIPQNEQLLKLFLRLAAHTANRLIRLRHEARLQPQPRIMNMPIDALREKRPMQFLHHNPEALMGNSEIGEKGFYPDAMKTTIDSYTSLPDNQSLSQIIKEHESRQNMESSQIPLDIAKDSVNQEHSSNDTQRHRLNDLDERTSSFNGEENQYTTEETPKFSEVLPNSVPIYDDRNISHVQDNDQSASINADGSRSEMSAHHENEQQIYTTETTFTDLNTGLSKNLESAVLLEKRFFSQDILKDGVNVVPADNRLFSQKFEKDAIGLTPMQNNLPFHNAQKDAENPIQSRFFFNQAQSTSLLPKSDLAFKTPSNLLDHNNNQDFTNNLIPKTTQHLLDVSEFQNLKHSPTNTIINDPQLLPPQFIPKDQNIVETQVIDVVKNQTNFQTASAFKNSSHSSLNQVQDFQESPHSRYIQTNTSDNSTQRDSNLQLNKFPPADQKILYSPVKNISNLEKDHQLASEFYNFKSSHKNRMTDSPLLRSEISQKNIPDNKTLGYSNFSSPLEYTANQERNENHSQSAILLKEETQQIIKNIQNTSSADVIQNNVNNLKKQISNNQSDLTAFGSKIEPLSPMFRAFFDGVQNGKIDNVQNEEQNVVGNKKATSSSKKTGMSDFSGKELENSISSNKSSEKEQSSFMKYVRFLNTSLPHKDNSTNNGVLYPKASTEETLGRKSTSNADIIPEHFQNENQYLHTLRKEDVLGNTSSKIMNVTTSEKKNLFTNEFEDILLRKQNNTRASELNEKLNMKLYNFSDPTLILKESLNQKLPLQAPNSKGSDDKQIESLIENKGSNVMNSSLNLNPLYPRSEKEQVPLKGQDTIKQIAEYPGTKSVDQRHFTSSKYEIDTSETEISNHEHGYVGTEVSPATSSEILNQFRCFMMPKNYIPSNSTTSNLPNNYVKTETRSGNQSRRFASKESIINLNDIETSNHQDIYVKPETLPVANSETSDQSRLSSKNKVPLSDSSLPNLPETHIKYFHIKEGDFNLDQDTYPNYDIEADLSETQLRAITNQFMSTLKHINQKNENVQENEARVYMKDNANYLLPSREGLFSSGIAPKSVNDGYGNSRGNYNEMLQENRKSRNGNDHETYSNDYSRQLNANNGRTIFDRPSKLHPYNIHGETTREDPQKEANNAVNNASQ